MSEVLEQFTTPEERVSRMRDCLSHALENDFANVEVLGAFIDLYDEHSKTLDMGIGLNPFFESLDFPEHDFEFGEPAYEDIIIGKYDALGGIRDRFKIHLRPESAEETEEAAPEAQDLNHDLDLSYDDVRGTSFRFPKLIHGKLGLLVDTANEKRVKTNKGEMVASLIAFHDLDEERLAALVMQYRETTRGEYLEQNPDL